MSSDIDADRASRGESFDEKYESKRLGEMMTEMGKLLIDSEYDLSPAGTIENPGRVEGEYWHILYWEEASANGDGQTIYSNPDWGDGAEYFEPDFYEREVLGIKEKYAILSWRSDGFLHLEYSDDLPEEPKLEFPELLIDIPEPEEE